MGTPERNHPIPRLILGGLYLATLGILFWWDYAEHQELSFQHQQHWIWDTFKLAFLLAIVNCGMLCPPWSVPDDAWRQELLVATLIAVVAFSILPFFAALVWLSIASRTFQQLLAIGGVSLGYSVWFCLWAQFLEQIEQGHLNTLAAESEQIARRRLERRQEEQARTAKEEKAKLEAAAGEARRVQAAEQARKAEAERAAKQARKADERRNKRQARQLERQQVAEQAVMNGEQPPASPSLQRRRRAAHREVLDFYHGLIPPAIKRLRTWGLTRSLDHRLAQATRATSIKAVVDDLIDRLTKIELRAEVAARYEHDHYLYCDNYPADQFYSRLRRFFRRNLDIEDIREAATMMHKSLDEIGGKLEHLRGEKQRRRELDQELNDKLAEIDAKGLRGEQSPGVIEQHKNFLRNQYRVAQKSVANQRRLRVPRISSYEKSTPPSTAVTKPEE